MSKKFAVDNTLSVQKGDVIWAPYRRDPLWPALVQNVYQNKKVTFLFFPLVIRENAKKMQSFSCNPKLVFSLAEEDLLPEDASKQLLEAFLAAVKHLKSVDKTVGSRISRRPDETGFIKMDESKIEEELARRASNELTDLLMNGVREDVAEKKKSRKRPHPERYISETAETNSSSLEEGVDPQFSRDELSDVADENNDVREEGTSTPIEDPVVDIVFRKGHEILDEIWNSDELMNYAVPTRHELNLQFKSLELFSDEDGDKIVDFIMQFIKSKQSEFSFVPAMHVTTTILLPELVTRAVQMSKNNTYEEASRLVSKVAESDSDDVMKDVEQDDNKENPLAILMEAACDAHSRASQGTDK